MKKNDFVSFLLVKEDEERALPTLQLSIDICGNAATFSGTFFIYITEKVALH